MLELLIINSDNAEYSGGVGDRIPTQSQNQQIKSRKI